MDPNSVFCPNPDCPACGKPGQGNIGMHSHTERRYICHLCKKTFAETKGCKFRLKMGSPALFVIPPPQHRSGCANTRLRNRSK